MHSNLYKTYLTKNEIRNRIFLLSVLKTKWLTIFLYFVTKLIIKLNLPFIKNIIYKKFLKVFIGGTSLKNCLETISKLRQNNIDVILDFGEEASKSENTNKKNAFSLLETVFFAREHQIPFVVVKISCIATEKQLENISSKKNNFENDYKQIATRLNTICKIASDNKIKIFIDAEESWHQGVIDDLCLKMMQLYNTKEALIFNTVQLYRKDRLDFLKNEISYFAKQGFFYGTKLVRGAYLEKENKRAKKLNYSSPIHINKEDTDRDFNDAINFCLKNIKTVSFIVASHNNESTQLCLDKIKSMNISKENVQKNIYFSQLYGMADDLTFKIISHGVTPLKYLPYGKLSKLLPYFYRRLQENSGINKQLDQEIAILKNLLKK